MPKIFVYGTLKRGESNHQHLAAGKFIGTATTEPGYALYRIADFPGLVAEHNAGAVSGEVWEVTDDHVAKLDAFEGVAEGLYSRHEIRITFPFENEKIETYLYAQEVGGKSRVGSSWRPTATT